jgi:hypothetical protein
MQEADKLLWGEIRAVQILKPSTAKFVASHNTGETVILVANASLKQAIDDQYEMHMKEKEVYASEEQQNNKTAWFLKARKAMN